MTGLMILLTGVLWAGSAEDAARAIEQQVVSPCCYSQTVDQHRSGAARDVRTDIRRMVESGMSEQAILDRLVEKHGSRVLAVPPASGFNASVWWMPGLAVLVGGLGLWAYVKNTSRKAVDERPCTLADSDRARLNALLEAQDTKA